MTIVNYVDGEAFGGTEQNLLHLFARLDRDRWDPVLFYHPHPDVQPLLDGARQLDVATTPLPRPRGPRGLAEVPALARAIRRERAGLFHAHLNWLLSCRFGLLAARLARVPVVATLQQFLVPPWKPNVYWQQRAVAGGVDRYVAVAQAVADQLSESFRVPPGKIEVIHNGVRVEQFSSGRQTSAGTTLQEYRRPLVLTVGRLDDQKGHRFLLEAVPQVPDATFLLAGDGENRPWLEQMADQKGVSDRVVFLGHRTDVSELLPECDLFVLPSLYEGFPLSVLEAMAAGVAVVATAVGGTPEAMQDGVTGYLVPSADPVRLAEAIRKALADPAGSRRMGRAGQQWVRRYSVAAMAERYMHLYEEMVGGHRQSHRGTGGTREEDLGHGRRPSGS